MSAALRSLGFAAIFIAGAALVCSVLGWALPLPEVPQVKEKLEWFRAHRGEYTALFLGTSRVRRGIIPSLFDRLAAEHGVGMRSFNLGVDSLFAPEDGYVLDGALAAEPARLRFVFIELSYFRADFSGQGPETIRAAYWHDWTRTRSVIRRLMMQERAQIQRPEKRKGDRWSSWSADVVAWAGVVAQHAALFLQRATHLGRGALMLQMAAGVRAVPDALAPLGPERDGFIPAAPGVVIHGAALEEFQRNLAAAPLVRSKPLDPVAQENLETMLAKVRAHGARPIILIAPAQGGLVFRPRREDAPVLDFSDPKEWPELFEPQDRADAGHLNTAGAEVFTRALAARFLSLAEER